MEWCGPGPGRPGPRRATAPSAPPGRSRGWADRRPAGLGGAEGLSRAGCGGVGRRGRRDQPGTAAGRYRCAGGWVGRHGDRLRSGAGGRRLSAAGGPQGAPPGAGHRGPGPPVLDRAADSLRAQPSEHRSAARRRLAVRRPSLSGHGAGGGPADHGVRRRPALAVGPGSTCSSRWRARFTPPIGGRWCTGTSSRRTSWWTTTAG